MNNYEHLHKTEQQLRLWYNDRLRNNKVGHMDFESFRQWYLNSEKVCHYCGLTEEQSQQIVRTSALTSKRFPKEGIHGRGTSRGMWLEIDKYDPQGKYEVGNIVLSCYFCNNDKSDIFHGDAYKKFMKDRIGFLTQFLVDTVDKVKI